MGTGRIARLGALQRPLFGENHSQYFRHIDGPVLRLRTSRGDTALIDMPAEVGGRVHAWLLISVPDMDAALRVARSCPEATFGDVRVLPVDSQGRLP